MRPETAQLLDDLESVDWFNAVGEPLPGGIADRILVVHSWAEACACSTSVAWENFTREQSNFLTQHLAQYAPERDREWNTITLDVNERLEGLVDLKLLADSPLVTDPETAELIRGSVHWNLLAACMEREYADVRPVGFFNELAGLYLLGRFPCGWGERQADGTIVLYEPSEETEYGAPATDWLKIVGAALDRVYTPRVQLPKVGRLVIY